MMVVLYYLIAVIYSLYYFTYILLYYIIRVIMYRYICYI